ncbi:MAG: hypothetical protein WBA12_03400 [Catalinimonas sp.]
MLRNFSQRPLWSKLWAVLVCLGAVFVLARLLTGGLTSFDYAVMAFTHVSILVDVLFVSGGPTRNARPSRGQ